MTDASRPSRAEALSLSLSLTKSQSYKYQVQKDACEISEVKSVEIQSLAPAEQDL